MPKGYPVTECKGCGRPSRECGTLSATYLCRECGNRRAIDNHIGLTTKSGPYWRLWRERLAASVGGVLVDNRRDTE
jgi:hypothetical protein